MRRRALLLLITTMATALIVSSGVALAEVINGNGGDNNLKGTNKADRINGRGGDDTIRALRGSDRVTGGLDSDTLNGGGGGDTYVFGNSWGVDTLSADASGRDTLDFSALTSDVQVILTPRATNEAESGTNTLNFPSTVVIEDIRGTSSSGDDLNGNDANNRIFGNGGTNGIYGEGGSDALFGGPERDFLDGGSGNDTLKGGEGDDRYRFEDGWGDDTITAGETSGNEVLQFYSLSSSVTVNLTPSANGEAVSGANTLNFPSTVVIEHAMGADRAGDTINGNALGNELLGLGGDDTINGGPGADTVYGEGPSAFGTGDDTIDVADGDAGDTVDCGPNATSTGDTVYVDVNTITLLDGSSQTVRLDTVDANCETVNEVETP